MGRIILKQGESADVPILASGEPGYCTDTKDLLIGDGNSNRRYGPTEEDFTTALKEKLEDLPTLTEITEALEDIHTQGTDTGTTSSTFQVGTDGPKLTKQTSSTLSIRTSDDANYANITAKSGSFKESAEIQSPTTKASGSASSTVLRVKSLDNLPMFSVYQDGSLDAHSSKLKNLGDPTANQDAATKKYVDDTGYVHPDEGSGTLTALTGASVLSTITINTKGHVTGTATRSLTTGDIGAEPAFTKGSAFNKDFGTTVSTVCQGNDARLSDVRTPTSHASTHLSTGSDAIAAATQTVGGLLSAADKIKLDGVATSANNYVHPEEGGGTLTALTGAVVPSTITVNTKGHVTGTATRSLTAGDIGAEPAFSKGTAFNKDFGTTESTVCQGNDARLSDARTPTGHTLDSHSNITITNLQTDQILKWNGTAWVNSTAAAGYTLPVAAAAVLGGVLSGTDITIDGSGNVTVNDNSHAHTIANVTDLQTTLNGKAPLTGTGTSGSWPISVTGSSASCTGNAATATTATTATNVSGGSVSATTGSFSGNLVAGTGGTGNLGLTTNDGYGNANLTFNHFLGIPDVSGSSGRITCGVDSTSATMIFQLANSTTAGVATALTTVLTLYSTYSTLNGYMGIASGDNSYTLYGPNAWGGYLYVGARPDTGGAQLIATDGGVHLDSTNGKPIYIGYYRSNPVNAYGSWTFNSTISGSITGSSGSCTGNAATSSVAGYCSHIGYSASGQSIAYTSSGGPNAYSQGSGAAMISFHRPGAYAINFGLDSDNILKVGGWSMGAVAYKIYSQQNVTKSTGDPSGGSDGDIWLKYT